VTKIEARKVLMGLGRMLYSSGVPKRDFVDNFYFCLDFDYEIEREAYALVPEVIPHIAEWLWNPMR